MPEQRRRDFVLPLPSINMPPAPLESRSRRSWQRAALLAACTDTYNKLASSINYLYNRARNKPTVSLPHLTHVQQTIYQQQHHSFSDSVSAHTLSGVKALLEASWNFTLRRDHCDDGRPLQGNEPDDTDNTTHTQPLPENLFTYKQRSQTLPVVAENVALPPTDNCVDMLSALSPTMRELYSQPGNVLRVDPPETMPRATVFASLVEYLALLRKLRARDMLGATTQPKAINGIHCTPKSGGALRMILDARPANALFAKPPKTQLPNPGLIASLLHADTANIFVCKVDSSNYFYQFRLPDAYLPFFALPSVRAGDIGFGQEYGDDTMIYPCLNRLPMGWSHSVAIAQDAHTHMVHSSGLLSPRDEIKVGNDMNLDRTRHCVYIDDLVLISTDRRHITDLQHRYIALAQHRGFPINHDKTVWPTNRPTDVLGVQLDGLNGTYGLSTRKLSRLITETRAVVRRGWASGDDMEVLIGGWTWAMLTKRATLAVFSAVYRFIRTAQYRVFSVWPSVAFELNAVIGLAPLLTADLNAGFFDRVLASDASMEGLGVVATPLAAKVQAFTSAMTGVEPASGNVPIRAQPVAVALSSSWYTTVSARWKRPLTHINLGELHAAHTAVKWTVRQPRSHGKRLLLFSDSTAAVGALSKGRSSAFSSLTIIRSISSLCLLFNVRLYVCWLPTTCNPADLPSRVFRH